MAAIRRNPTLSEDLISEILVRVPVKSLLCFQSVCKTWLSLIKHPAFVRSQLRHAITTQTDQKLIISRLRSYEEEKKFSLLDVDSREIVADLEFPRSPGALETAIVGSVNGIVGIVCVAVTVNVTLETSIYLWNPAIRKFKVIPSYSIGIRSKEVWGFGYDPIGHDYKVVRVVSWRSLRAVQFCSGEVYSANDNVWRKVPDPIVIPRMGDFDVCVNGYLCGIGKHGMVSFDLNKEVFSCGIKLPVICELIGDEARIIEFNQSIAVVILLNALNDGTDRELDKKINLWSLDDDACLRGGGVEPSWTIMFSIDLATLGYLFLGYFCNEDLLLLILAENHVFKWISCNANKKEAKIFPLSVDMAKYNYYYRGVNKYTESLVSLAGFKQVNYDAGEDDN